MSEVEEAAVICLRKGGLAEYLPSLLSSIRINVNRYLDHASSSDQRTPDGNLKALLKGRDVFKLDGFAAPGSWWSLSSVHPCTG